MIGAVPQDVSRAWPNELTDDAEGDGVKEEHEKGEAQTESKIAPERDEGSGSLER